METIYYRRIDTKIGRLMIASTRKGLCCVGLPGELEERFIEGLKKTYGKCDLWDEDGKGEKSSINDKALEELLLYFDGKLKQFTVPLDMRGTDFQKKVWQQLLKIPYGKTASYGDIARAIGKPGASRAVGGANNKNPLPIVVPCHRVVGSDGSLVGYGGGLEIKKFLLRLESAY
ncbi:MAG: methylated-DNA-[protein]-cysteine S-methyltransferase [Thermoanaerobacteraceae bacterium]|jgi:O-6-methylguanine DNA methyltransferase|uniref:Methylated-DNA--protein-cysteine methyltransferase n=1 Tax=Biomaibacter acetigenes TaxID=2316383 RepID=A0A3G2RA91_9FIRM|nr:methylated-DNA--[protein]-cysteine S-methyltransferase [Biomaibacter acetigenes]AYO31647.1 methylated-DNA--[protein]-cysteine S-methyltransferase [Biomaibacter acetigenes]MDK2878268.1 methylated-DNA-[protein]-cysteine S-methyltransferase [Thermoanaerobacteraceae bacterium]